MTIDDALRIVCPTCAAREGVGCWTPKGVARAPHNDRVLLARLRTRETEAVARFGKRPST